jgi:hypothetical protein
MAKKPRIERKTPKGEGVEFYKKAKGAFVKVGILSGTGEHPKGKHGQTFAEIGWWNEFGTDRILPRPFLRTGLLDNIGRYRGVFKIVVGKVLTRKMSHDQAVAVIGEMAKADVQAKIVAIRSPENAELTKKLKKSSNPLIDTGALRQHINWAKV